MWVGQGRVRRRRPTHLGHATPTTSTTARPDDAPFATTSVATSSDIRVAIIG